MHPGSHPGKVFPFDNRPNIQIVVENLMSIRLMTHAEQVAAHLRPEILRGRWGGSMPGIVALGKQLGVNHNTVDAALGLLEEEGVLENQGSGRPRRIVVRHMPVRHALRIRILLFDAADRRHASSVELLHQLLEAGHNAAFAGRTLEDLRMNVKRIARHVAEHEADAWIVCAASREVLAWFAEQAMPTFAMFGRMAGLPVAGMSPRKAPALAAGMRRLADLGHWRICLLTRGTNRFEHPSLFERAFLDELIALGITPGPYHLPDWDETREGIQRCLDSLFRVTPPTALIVCEPPLFIAVQQHLAHKGILSPRDVSLLCDDPDPAFQWCEPTIAHIDWDERPILQRIMQWAGHVAVGKTDHRQSRSKSRFIHGGTIGPAPDA